MSVETDKQLTLDILNEPQHVLEDSHTSEEYLAGSEIPPEEKKRLLQELINAYTTQPREVVT